MLLGEALYNCHPSCKEAFARLRASQPCGQGGIHRRHPQTMFHTGADWFWSYQCSMASRWWWARLVGSHELFQDKEGGVHHLIFTVRLFDGVPLCPVDIVPSRLNFRNFDKVGAESRCHHGLQAGNGMEVGSFKRTSSWLYPAVDGKQLQPNPCQTEVEGI